MSRTRILLADDHALMLNAFRKLLETEYEIAGTAGDGQALVEAAESLKPEVIITDIGMPKLNGLDACELLKKSLPQTKVIMLTVYEDPDIAEDAMRRGADGFLLKKTGATEVFDAIKSVLDGRKYVTQVMSPVPVRKSSAGPLPGRKTLAEQDIVPPGLAAGET